MYKAYHGTGSLNSKRLAAQRLLEIDSAMGNEGLANEYLDFLVQNSYSSDQQGETISILTELHRIFLQQKTTRIHHQKILGIKRMITVVIVVVLCILLTLIVFNRLSHKRKECIKTQLDMERTAFKFELAALSGKIRKKNEIIQSLERTALEKDRLNRLLNMQPEITAQQYLDEPICQHILEVCNDDKNLIKSVVSTKEYESIALTKTQLAELNKAAMKHYGALFELIGNKYPKLKGKDLVYCQLCLIGLNSIQISALLQKTPSTISSQKKRLQQIFGQNNDIAVILNSFIIH